MCIVISSHHTRPLLQTPTLYLLGSSKVSFHWRTRIDSNSKRSCKSFTISAYIYVIHSIISELFKVCIFANYSAYTDEPVLDATDWAAVLHLAGQWSFSSIRKLAILRLWKCSSDVDKVVYGHRYHVDEWLLPGYVALCERDEALTLEEGKRLGVGDVIAITRAREALRSKSSIKSTSPSSSTTYTSSSSSPDRRVDLPCFECRRFHVYTVSHWQTTVDCRFCCRSIPVSKVPTIFAKSTLSLSMDQESLQQKVKELITRCNLRYGVQSALVS